MRRFLASAILTAGLLSFTGMAQALSVQSGLSPYQVLQCDSEGKASAVLSGTATADGPLQWRLVGVQKEILPWTDAGAAAGGAWTATLTGLPVGGPYRVELRVNDAQGKEADAAALPEILVGDVWVLAGQSNMQGVGNRVHEEAPHPLVHTFSMSYEWRLAQEPLHTLAESPDSVHGVYNTEEERRKAISDWRDGAKGAGLGIAFAKEMVARTGRPVGLIASAHGGTSMAQWDPTLKEKGGESLYGSAFKQALAAGGKIRGILWYQGESDAFPEPAAVYREKMKQLVAAMRSDAGRPDLPFYYVQISRFAGDIKGFPAWNKIQEDQRLLESDLAPGALVPAIDLAMDDGIHIGTAGLKTLGYRIAALAEHDLYGGKVLRGPRFEKMEVVGTAYGRQIRLHFTSVNGGLKAAGRPTGFSATDGPEGPEIPFVFNTEIDPGDPTTLIVWINDLPENAFLWYGHGLNPYCNITDEANMALPVMGPLPIPR